MSSTCEARAPARHHADLLLLEALPPSEEPQPRSAQFRIRRYIPVRGEIRILKNALTGALALRNVCLYVQWAWRRVRGGCERTHLDQQHCTALVPSCENWVDQFDNWQSQHIANPCQTDHKCDRSGLPACQLAFWSTSSQLGPLRPNHASSELAPACLANRPSCTVEAACCLDRAAWLSVVAANMRSWPVLTQPRGPTGRRPKGALNSAQTGESAAEVCNYSR